MAGDSGCHFTSPTVPLDPTAGEPFSWTTTHTGVSTEFIHGPGGGDDDGKGGVVGPARGDCPANCENRVHMPLVKPITKHGNSAGIILEQAVLKMVDWEVGTKVEIQVTNDSIVLKRHPTDSRRSTDRSSKK